MLSYAGISLQMPGPEEAAWLSAVMPPDGAFGYFRAKSLGKPALNPRPHLNWFLRRPARLNVLFHPWGASRWGYMLCLADADMLGAILAINTAGTAYPLVIGDGLGRIVTTPMFMLPPVPLSKIAAVPPLTLHLLPLVDERYFWWERSAAITVTEGTTTWANLFSALATGLGITLNVDPISADYLMPGSGFAEKYQHLPLLLDLAASSVGHRIVRRFDGSFHSISSTTATSILIANANTYPKQAGGSFNFGVVDA